MHETVPQSSTRGTLAVEDPGMFIAWVGAFLWYPRFLVTGPCVLIHLIVIRIFKSSLVTSLSNALFCSGLTLSETSHIYLVRTFSREQSHRRRIRT